MFDLLEKIPQGRVIRPVAGQYLIGKGEAFGRDHQRNDHLYAVAAFVTAVSETALALIRGVALEVGAGQVVQQDIERSVEQVAPAANQVIKQRLLVFQQSVMTGVEPVNVHYRAIHAQQICQRATIKPLPVQPPLAARRNPPVRHQHQQHLIPARTFTTARQTLEPEPIQSQFAPQRQRQPTGTPLARPTQTQRGQPQPDHRLIDDSLVIILGKQRQGAWSLRTLYKYLDALAPRIFLQEVDLAQIQHVPLHHTATTDTSILHDAPIAMHLAVFITCGCS